MLAILFQEKTKKNAEKNASIIKKGRLSATHFRKSGHARLITL